MRKWLRGILFVGVLLGWATTGAGYLDQSRDHTIVNRLAMYLAAVTAAVIIGRWAGKAMTPRPLGDGYSAKAPEWEPSCMVFILAVISLIFATLTVLLCLPDSVFIAFIVSLPLATFAWYEGPQPNKPDDKPDHPGSPPTPLPV